MRIMAEKKVSWGVLGTAWIARTQTLPAMTEASNCRRCAIAGRSLEKAEQFRREFGFERAYGSYEALLDDPEVEAVYIPLPNQLHWEWIARAARKKKHILCEKPLAGTPEQVRQAVELCRAEGVLLMEGFAYLHSPATRAVLDAVHSGAIGRPAMIESSFIVRYFGDENIRSRRETLGGTTYDQGCYNISLILALLGEAPCAVKAMGRFAGSGIDIYSDIFMEFPSGAIANALQAMHSPNRGDRFFVYGEEGILEAPLPFNAKGPLHYYIHRDGQSRRFDLEVPDNYRLEFEQFGRCILEGEQPLVSNAFSIQVAETLHQALEEMGYD